jgi:acetyl-CoA C-acetyltransferase/3-oxo-5,6-didehydrosuberyl-CoA/3-oxoadipyl-CoA thiolase
MKEAWIVEGLRTPIGKYGGVLKDMRADDLAADVIRALVRRTEIETDLIDDVIFGCANQAGEDSRNVARIALLLAGLPYTIPGATVNRLCGSGLEAINHATAQIQSGRGDVFIAGGVESMSRAPLVMPKPDRPFPKGEVTVYDSALGWRFPNKKLAQIYPLISLGETAENLAVQYNVSRQEQDVFALESHQNALRAQDEGLFKNEIVPIEVPGEKGKSTLLERDEGPRRETSLEKLSLLKPAFKADGTVTAGNSSMLNDGAAALLLMSREKAQELNTKPLGRIVTSAVAGVDPSFMGIGPVPATQKALQRASIRIQDIDWIEINEAFASQALACIRALELDRRKVNPNGGAIAIGHPLGCSGARLVLTLLNQMQRTDCRYGIATLCIGIGQGIATIVEKC